jgi:hypothetical protein
MTEDDSDVRFARGSSGDLPEDGLARDLSDLARQMQAEASIDSLFDSIVAAALREVEAAEYAGSSLIEARRVHTEADIRRADREDRRAAVSSRRRSLSHRTPRTPYGPIGRPADGNQVAGLRP